MERSMKKIWVILFVAVSTVLPNLVKAQSAQFTVTVNSEQLFAQQKTDPQTMTQLQTYINDFLNNTRWSDDAFAKEERIKCKLNINLTRSVALGSYEGNAQLVVSRPVFNSNYESVLLTYIDKNFSFNFLPGTQLYFNESSFTDELPYALAFYAYVAMTVDYDSFSKLGGTPYLQKAFNISNQARNASSNKRAWENSINNTNSRYSLIENLMSQQFTPFREGMYTYYREGLDVATQNPVETRSKVMEVLNTIREVSLLRPASVVINSFFDAKSDELCKILVEGTSEQKKQAYTLLVSLDPSKTQVYQRLAQ
jgi:hypothetical protein